MDEAQNKSESWVFHDDSDAYQSSTATTISSNEVQPISWRGSEFVQNQKSLGWYATLVLALVVVCGIIYLVSRDIISVVFVGIIGVLFAIIAGRKPRELDYLVDSSGIKVGSKNYNFSDYKSFSIQRHKTGLAYISLMPLHRFHNELSIYFPNDKERQIIEILGGFLPNLQRKDTLVDRFANIIKF